MVAKSLLLLSMRQARCKKLRFGIFQAFGASYRGGSSENPSPF